MVRYAFEYEASGFAGSLVFVDRLKDYWCFSSKDPKNNKASQDLMEWNFFC